MNDVKELLLAKLDPLEFLDLLDIDFETLIDRFKDEIGDNWEDVIDALNS